MNVHASLRVLADPDYYFTVTMFMASSNVYQQHRKPVAPYARTDYSRVRKLSFLSPKRCNALSIKPGLDENLAEIALWMRLLP